MSIDLENWERNGTKEICVAEKTQFFIFHRSDFFFPPHHNPLFVRSRTHYCTLYTSHTQTLHPNPRILQHQHRRKVPVIYPNTVSVSYLCTLLKGAWLLAILNLAKMYHIETLT